MTNTSVSFSGRTLDINGKSIVLEYPILNAFTLRDRIIVLFDPDAHIEKFGQFRNLIALSLSGERLWTAELPTNQSGDTYFRVDPGDRLLATSFHSFECEIDEATGRIKQRTFTK